jgi:uncharacterized protein (TIGR03435 family)
MRKHIAAMVVMGLWTTRPSPAQSPARLEFEVASVKQGRAGARGNSTEIAPGGERFTATNASLKLLIMTAYGVTDRQVSGGPNWVNTEYYDIDAKTDRPASRERICLMLQTLLTDRFQLKLHRETKELPMYVLTVEKAASRLRENKSGDKPQVRTGDSGQVVFQSFPMAQLAWFLSVRLRRDVMDKTELKGGYDFELAYTPDTPSFGDGAVNVPPADPNRPGILDAVRDQFGLTLQPQKAPVEIFVIDHAEKPLEN